MNWTIERMNRELKKFDPMLRARRSVTNGGMLLIERKCARESACLTKPLDQRVMDRYIQDRDGYVSVMPVPSHAFGREVFLYLRERDMWDKGGADKFVNELEEEERQAEAAKDKDQKEMLECLGEEAYDKQMIKQGDIVSSFESKVGGWEPGNESSANQGSC